MQLIEKYSEETEHTKLTAYTKQTEETKQTLHSEGIYCSQ